MTWHKELPFQSFYRVHWAGLIDLIQKVSTRKGLVLFAWKQSLKGQKTFGVLFCIYSVRRESDLRSEKMENWFIGPRLLTEEDIPGSSLSGRNPSALKNTELKFWLRCRGDSCKGLKTKAFMMLKYDAL